jgi:hypothetical protein
MQKNASKKQTQEQQVVELLKKGWFSNFGMQQKLKSSSADRAFRRAREKGLDGYEFKQRTKKVNGYNTCYEYRIVKLEDVKQEVRKQA